MIGRFEPNSDKLAPRPSNSCAGVKLLGSGEPKQFDKA